MMQTPQPDSDWTNDRDGYTHTPSGMRVLPCGLFTFAVVKGGKQVRTTSGRLRRWFGLDRAQAFVEQSHYMGNELYIEQAITVLESIAAVSSEAFQARKVGMRMIVPPEVEIAYVRKHGEEGKRLIYKLRGDVNL